jgi:hypothetical protein
MSWSIHRRLWFTFDLKRAVRLADLLLAEV